MELIKVVNKKDEQLVNARELHKFLESKTQYTDWFYSQSERAMLEENLDYITVTEKKVTAQGNSSKQTTHHLTLNAAKEIAMLNGGEKGKQARRYFLECEKQVKERAKLSWQEGRKLLKDEYAPMSEAVKEIREAQGKETKHYHYSNEANLICMVLKGMTVAKYKKLFNQGQFRDSLSTEDIAMLTRLQNINTGLIHADWDYDKRKAYLTKYYDGKKNLRLVQPHQQKLKEGA